MARSTCEHAWWSEHIATLRGFFNPTPDPDPAILPGNEHCAGPKPLSSHRSRPHLALLWAAPAGLVHDAVEVEEDVVVGGPSPPVNWTHDTWEARVDPCVQALDAHCATSTVLATAIVSDCDQLVSDCDQLVNDCDRGERLDDDSASARRVGEPVKKGRPVVPLATLQVPVDLG